MKIKALLQDLEDIQEIQEHLTSPTETFPLEVAQSLAAGDHPIKVFRKYRAITQEALSKLVGVSKQYISQLENNERDGTTKIVKKIAKILNVDLDDITG